MIKDIPETMAAVLLTGHGGFDKLEYRTDVPVPKPKKSEVLIRVGAAGVNNTDINTRIGWYSKGVSEDTNRGGSEGFASARDEDAGWAGIPISFPRIQGADCCGEVAAVGEDIDPGRIGQRVIVRNMLRTYVDYRPYECWTLGSECDGAFAQYVVAPAEETYGVSCDWTDAELASIPCAYSTAENMLQRAALKSGEKVLITGASGGVGSAAVQLAKRRGAEVFAVTDSTKLETVRALGAEHVIPRGEKFTKTLGSYAVDLVVDLVAGPQWPELINTLRRGGRYAVAGAIAGPMVELDVRTLYLRDLSFFGCTFQEDAVFENLIGYIERGEIRPVVAKANPLKDIVAAQKDFLAKNFTGKLVLELPKD
jgi:NADPH:quinone reductase-like Zn-dependent oxidoreductase